MRHAFVKVVFTIISIFLISGFSGCARLVDTGINNDKIRVIVSIPPQAEFAEKVGGDKVAVTVMVPPGANPHTYEPSPAQLEEVSKAQIYARVGSAGIGSGIEFELAWMDKIININKKMLVVDSSRGVKFVAVNYENGEPVQYNEYDENNKDASNPEGIDPHIWLSPSNAKIMSENIYEGLVNADPENQKYYKGNLDNYLTELEELDEEISRMFAGKENKVIMVFHPTWTYFALDYGIKQMAIEEEGKEPTAEGIKALIDKAREYNIKVIFASPEFSTKSAEAVAGEIGGSVVLVSSLKKNYVENMKKVAMAFAGSMK
ncbi:MAG: zinc ABC transporter substrate-binding protein [Actinomycetota bacterium]|nr:zinc ABC transporter substrate-binding protein [Actinomycetota bacterium]